MTEQREARSRCCNGILDPHHSAFDPRRVWYYCLTCDRQCDVEGNATNWREVGSPDDDFRTALEGLEHWRKFVARRSRPIYTRHDYMRAQEIAYFFGAGFLQTASCISNPDALVREQAWRMYSMPFGLPRMKEPVAAPHPTTDAEKATRGADSQENPNG